MFLNDKHSENKPAPLSVNFFSSTLKQNVIDQAASMLLQHVTLHRTAYPIARNSNGNALDEHRHRLSAAEREKREVRRASKCNSWLSKSPSKSDTSVNRPSMHSDFPLRTLQPHVYSPPTYDHPRMEHRDFPVTAPVYMPSRIHSNQFTLSTNAITNTPTEPFSQPLIVVHKKRLRRDSFLSTMQNCIQPPYSPNHFYALDQANMLKLQRNFRSYPSERHPHDEDRPNHFKRKHFEDEDHEVDRTSPFEHTSPQTADHISMHKYHREPVDPSPFENPPDHDQPISLQKSEASHVILLRLEKILDLCGELRSIAKDVEVHLNEHSISKTASIEMNEKERGNELDSEETTIDIYKELEQQQQQQQQPATADRPEQNTLPSYPPSHDISSVHSESTKSIQLMQTESFKTKSPCFTTSQAKLRTSEDLCACFLKSLLQQDNCELTGDEHEYLNELTKAYMLGREQTLREQQETNGNFQALLKENVPQNSDERILTVYETNNNNQSIDLSHTDLPKPDDSYSIIPPRTKSSTVATTHEDQQLSGLGSLKQQLFLQEPISLKPTSVLPGIGRKYAEQLEECGFATVRRLLGFYLMLKDDQQFVVWLNNKSGVSVHSAWLCVNALRAWCQTHL